MQDLLISVHLYALADKYNISIIREPIIQSIQSKLLNYEGDEDGDLHLKAVVKAHYEKATSVGGPLGTLVATHIVINCSRFMEGNECMQLIMTYSTFGADMALAALLNAEFVVCWG